MSVCNAFKQTISLCCVLSLTACAMRQPKLGFRVLPRDPDYLLQAPDSRRTPFSEVLRAYNGFEAGHSSIDLRALMELRIENAYYKEGASRRGLEGFVGTEVAHYLVRPRGLKLLSVQLMENRPASEPGVQHLISPSQTSFNFYRLYYEIVFARSTHSHGSVLLGGTSPEELDTLSAELTDPEKVCYPGSIHCTVFPEACSVSVEMEILVNGAMQTVVWGSRLGDVVQNSRELKLRRLYAGQPAPVEVRLKDSKVLSLPLLPGDQINWR
jgi:hypothetical protein